MPADARQVAVARWLVPLVLGPHLRRDDIMLVISELVTNAFMHGSSADGDLVRVRITRLPYGFVHVCVIDQGRAAGAPAAVPRPGVDEDSGLGSLIVDELAWISWQRHVRSGRRAHAIFAPRRRS